VAILVSVRGDAATLRSICGDDDTAAAAAAAAEGVDCDKDNCSIIKYLNATTLTLKRLFGTKA
jgi:hypothetical protein